MSERQKPARLPALVFVALVALIGLGMLWAIVSTPYDSGVLAGAALSGNNQYGGAVTATNDYLFYVADGGIQRVDRGTGERQTVYTGPASYLNAYDGWLYFVADGRIVRMAYYGGLGSFVGACDSVSMLSVNGLWLYYTDGAGALYKVRADGRQTTCLTGPDVTVKAFEAANRIVVFTDGKTLYRMKTDGADRQVLAEGPVERMLYTLDDVYYAAGGAVNRLQSVEAGRPDGTSFSPLQADLFTFTTTQKGRGMVYYYANGALRLRLLQSGEDPLEEESTVLAVDRPRDLYVIGTDLLFHTADGTLMRVDTTVSHPSAQPME